MTHPGLLIGNNDLFRVNGYPIVFKVHSPTNIDGQIVSDLQRLVPTITDIRNFILHPDKFNNPSENELKSLITRKGWTVSYLHPTDDIQVEWEKKIGRFNK